MLNINFVIVCSTADTANVSRAHLHLDEVTQFHLDLNPFYVKHQERNAMNLKNTIQFIC